MAIKKFEIQYELKFTKNRFPNSRCIIRTEEYQATSLLSHKIYFEYFLYRKDCLCITYAAKKGYSNLMPLSVMLPTSPKAVRKLVMTRRDFLMPPAGCRWRSKQALSNEKYSESFAAQLYFL